MSLMIDQLAGAIVDGDLVLIELLGEGGMGVAYRGRQQSLNRDVCVKFMRAEIISDSEWLERFKREATVLSRLRAEHIVSVYYVGVWESVYPYIVMELLEGESLRKLIGGGLDWRRACELMIQVCDALGEVHDLAIVHRDLKPDNILVTQRDGHDFIKLLDFGLCAGANSQRLTRTNDILGSVFYMAPECFRESQRSLGVDIYALGCTMYEMLTGSPPYLDDNPVALAYKHGSAPVPALPSRVAEAQTRDVLDGVLRKACAKAPNERFQSCAEMSVILKQVLHAGPSDTLLSVLPPVAVPVRQQGAGWSRTLIILLSSFVVLLLLSSEQIRATAQMAFYECQCTIDEMTGAPECLGKEAQRSLDSGDYRRATVYWQRGVRKESNPSSKIDIEVSLARVQLLQHNVRGACSYLSQAIDNFCSSCTDGYWKQQNDRNEKFNETLENILSLVQLNTTSSVSAGSLERLNSLCALMERRELRYQGTALERVLTNSTNMMFETNRSDLIATIAEMRFREGRCRETIEFLCRNTSEATASRLRRIGCDAGACEPEQLRDELARVRAQCTLREPDRFVLILLPLRTFETKVLLERQKEELTNLFREALSGGVDDWPYLVGRCLERHKKVMLQTDERLFKTLAILGIDSEERALLEYKQLSLLFDDPEILTRVIGQRFIRVSLLLRQNRVTAAYRAMQSCLASRLWKVALELRGHSADEQRSKITQMFEVSNNELITKLDSIEAKRWLMDKEYRWVVALLPSSAGVKAFDHLTYWYHSELYPSAVIEQNANLICDSIARSKDLPDNVKLAAFVNMFWSVNGYSSAAQRKILTTMSPFLTCEHMVHCPSSSPSSWWNLQHGYVNLGMQEEARLVRNRLVTMFGLDNVLSERLDRCKKSFHQDDANNDDDLSLGNDFIKILRDGHATRTLSLIAVSKELSRLASVRSPQLGRLAFDFYKEIRQHFEYAEGCRHPGCRLVARSDGAAAEVQFLQDGQELRFGSLARLRLEQTPGKNYRCSWSQCAADGALRLVNEGYSNAAIVSISPVHLVTIDDSECRTILETDFTVWKFFTGHQNTEKLAQRLRLLLSDAKAPTSKICSGIENTIDETSFDGIAIARADDPRRLLLESLLKHPDSSIRQASAVALLHPSNRLSPPAVKNARAVYCSYLSDVVKRGDKSELARAASQCVYLMGKMETDDCRLPFLHVLLASSSPCAIWDIADATFPVCDGDLLSKEEKVCLFRTVLVSCWASLDKLTPEFAQPLAAGLDLLATVRGPALTYRVEKIGNKYLILAPARDVLRSPESAADFIVRHVLERERVAKDRWIVDLIKKGATYRQVVEAIVKHPSGEFKQTLPQEADSRIQALYRRILRRESLDAERCHWRSMNVPIEDKIHLFIAGGEFDGAAPLFGGKVKGDSASWEFKDGRFKACR